MKLELRDSAVLVADREPEITKKSIFKHVHFFSTFIALNLDKAYWL